jgi:hypothetical protein
MPLIMIFDVRGITADVATITTIVSTTFANSSSVILQLVSETARSVDAREIPNRTAWQ